METFHRSIEAYLRKNPALFLNSNCSLHLQTAKPCIVDLLAVDFGNKTVWLCAGGLGKTSDLVMSQLRSWQTLWPLIQLALWRDQKVPLGFEMRPWVFVDAVKRPLFDAAFASTDMEGHMPSPRFTHTEQLGEAMLSAA